MDTLKNLKEMIDNAIEKYGEDATYLLAGCYGSTGSVEKVVESDTKNDSQPSVYLYTDLCSG